MTGLKVTIEIKTGFEDDFKNGFLKAVEKPPEYQHLTDVQFFKQWLQDCIKSAYKTGKIMIAQQTTTPTIETDIVTVT